MAISVKPSEAPAKSADCLAGNLGWLLAQASDALTEAQSDVLAPLGLTPRGFCVLASAEEHGHTQIELANLVGVDKTTMVVTLDALERDGLAKRLPSERDRRVRVISVTAKGRRALARAREALSTVQDDVLGLLEPDEREALLSALTTLVRNRSRCGAT
jgi:MarR family transcriptional regulator, transcriptional regulator for hemolysin